MKLVIEECTVNSETHEVTTEKREQNFEHYIQAFEAYKSAKEYWNKRGILLELRSGLFTSWLTNDSWVSVEISAG